jgi:hypothetical protein
MYDSPGRGPGLIAVFKEDRLLMVSMLCRVVR